MNERLLLAAKKSKPYILFVIMGDTISPETLEKIRKSGIATVNWFHDSVVAPIRKDFVREYSGYYDYFTYEPHTIAMTIRPNETLIRN